MRRGRSSDEADDLVQEAWVRLACYERVREAVADPDRDEEGKALEAARQPGQAPAASVSVSFPAGLVRLSFDAELKVVRHGKKGLYKRDLTGCD